MKTFVFSLVCAGLLVACGDDTVPVDHPHPDLVDVDHPHSMLDHEHPAMVPAVHEHPDAVSVGALEATGHYVMEFLLTGNSCKDDFDPDAEVYEPAGVWTLAALQDEYIFFSGDFMLSSDDGSLFTLNMEFEPNWMCEGGETYNFITNLVFPFPDITGDYTKHYVGLECATWDADGNKILEDYDCTFTWDLRGTQVVE